MPAASISNGHTGPLRPANSHEIGEFLSIVGAAFVHSDAVRSAESTIGRKLHVVEFWMPGGCNLHCSHCYVATTANRPVLSSSEYQHLVRRMVSQGMVDVVIPGMEPLLRDETWGVIETAHEAGARSIGITTNATLLSRRLGRIKDAPLTVMNVSLDGTPEVHDAIRGKGVFRVAMKGVSMLRPTVPKMRIISNCTVSTHNQEILPDVAAIAADHQMDFAAFHPFERSAEIDNSVELTAAQTADAYEALRSAFEKGNTGSIVLEMEASRFDVLIELSERGWFSDMELLSDDTGFLFFGICRGSYRLLVNLMAYPHHFIRTIRVSDDGGLSSCRAMAKNSWHGIGDLRTNDVETLLASTSARDALATIWSEFNQACARVPAKGLQRLLDTVGNAVPGTARHELPGFAEAV